MVTQANNITDAKNLHQRRVDRATVQSLARIDTPPDTLALTSALQTTLELEEMLAIFKAELARHIDIDGLTLRHHDSGVLVQQGQAGRHRASYGLTLHEESLGELTLSRQSPFSEKTLALTEHLLCPLLYPLRNALRYQTALAAAFIDPLTGVNNRAALEQALPREIELAHRHAFAVSMLVVDLDHFKQINDSYGHSAGDCVLRETARHIKNALRTTDHVFRYGGEEFVILLPATESSGAQIVAERIRAAIAAEPCHCDGSAINVTASIGYAEIEQSDNRHTLFDKADKALYQAKDGGRNRIAAY
ncbi:MAG: GGDEF domain-containing protein [Pseudomonadota bacterium]